MIKMRLKELREEKGITQTKLAMEIGIKQRALSSYETGEFEPPLAVIKKLCDYFGVTSDYLLGFSEF